MKDGWPGSYEVRLIWGCRNVPSELEQYIVYLSADVVLEKAPRDCFGSVLNVLNLPSRDFSQPFESRFDQLFERINLLDGGYCEGDGAFGWHPSHDPRSHLSGTIHFHDERPICVEVYGQVTPGSWLEFSRQMEWTNDLDRLIIQFPMLGVFVSHDEFLVLLSRSVVDE